MKNFSSSINKDNNIISPENKILTEKIEEPHKIFKYLLNLIIFLGGSGFLITGISSYLGYNFINILNAKEILFFPQGITMCFYGTIGIVLSINQTFIIFNGIGEGYNEFNKSKGIMKIFRKGFPGKNSDIDIIYSLNDIEAIRLDIKTELFNTRQNIFVCIKGKPDLPILQLNTPIKLRELEDRTSKLASFLNVSVKGI
uniref:Photosystem I assembly protein Ycf4 n=1 Tax=Euglena anabaena TaxID=38273 RepID=A0A0G3F6S3_EUGAN|nr:photosystem I assembly protein ycf4 [Euglenaria anabaena]AKJ83379.1 photosystem I assembly protein ycf4 [Euglenaria anabaena]